ncbi:MAG: squalene/phytoene synthase family protein [Novosphingobium sp.]
MADTVLPPKSPAPAPGLHDTLAPLARLALAYAPAAVREDWLTLLALDARLAAVVRQSREPVLGQIRLAWWRERLEGLGEAPPPAEPLLARIAALDGAAQAGQALAGLVNGWEALLAEPPLTGESFNNFAVGRAQAISWIATRHGADKAAAAVLGRRWALADLALHLGDPAERDAAAALLTSLTPPPLQSRVLRPIAILEAVSVRALSGKGISALTSPSALVIAMRIGLFGR